MNHIPFWLWLLLTVATIIGIWVNYFGPCSQPVAEMPGWCL